MTTQPGLTYVRRSTCELHMDPLNDRAATDFKVLRVGQISLCDDCGREWRTVQEIVWGGLVTVKWQCTRPPGTPDPMDAVNARLATLEASNTSLGGTAAAQSALLTAQAAQIAALTAKVTALEGRTVTHRLGQVAIPAILLGAKADVTLTWSTPFPDTAYDPQFTLPAALIGKATVALKTKTAAAVTYTVTATLAVALGSALEVEAIRYA